MKTKLALMLGMVLSASAQAQVLPNDAVVEGKTIGDWSAEWWKWAFTVPFSEHPGSDTNGARAHIGQPAGPVFFLAGIFQISGTARRAFSVPEGKFLFFPLITHENDNIDGNFTVEQLQDLTTAGIDLVSELHTSIDGVSVPDLFSHRAMSPVFNVDVVSSDNLYSFFLGRPFVGLVDPIVAEGYYLMIEPLPPGTHVINFGGAVGPPVNFSRDVTDTITVVATPLPERVRELISAVEASSLSRKHLRPLVATLRGAEKSFARNHIQVGTRHLRAFQKKVHHEITRIDPALAEQFIRAAQQIIDRASQHLENDHRTEKPPHEK